MEFTYRTATLADIPGILAVQEANLLSKWLAEGASQGKVENEGFIVHGMSAAEWEELLASPDEVAAFVCRESEQVLGYCVGYLLARHRREHPAWAASVRLLPDVDPQKLLANDVLYYRQKVVLPGNKGRGIFFSINMLMAERVRALGCRSTFGEILKKPYFNRASYPPPGGRGAEIGEILEISDGTEYTWALVEFPIAPK